MVRKRKGAAAVAVMDTAVTTGVRTRARVAAAASSSAGAAKTSDGGSKNSVFASLKLSSNDSTCTQAKSSVARRSQVSAVHPVPPPPPAAAEEEDVLCLSSSSDDEASVSCCSSYGSTEMEKKKESIKFADLADENEVSEAECDYSASSPFARERREMDQSRGEEETDSINSSLNKSPEPEPNPPERSREEIQSSVVDEAAEGRLNTNNEPEGLLNTDNDEREELICNKATGNPEIMMPSQFDMGGFFAAAEAKNLSDLEHYKRKYNFDFVAEEPLEGRFEWHKVSPTKELIK